MPSLLIVATPWPWNARACARASATYDKALPSVSPHRSDPGRRPLVHSSELCIASGRLLHRRGHIMALPCAGCVRVYVREPKARPLPCLGPWPSHSMPSLQPCTVVIAHVSPLLPRARFARLAHMRGARSVAKGQAFLGLGIQTRPSHPLPCRCRRAVTVFMPRRHRLGAHGPWGLLLSTLCAEPIHTPSAHIR